MQVVEPMKKDKGKAAKNIAAGAAVGAVAGGITGRPGKAIEFFPLLVYVVIFGV